MGRGIYEGSPRTERVQLEPRTSDPSNPANGEAWLRTDLTGTDKVGEYRWFDGASVNAVDIVTPGSTSAPVEEVLRVQTPNGKGVVKTAPRSDATYPEQSLQHAGSPLGLGYSAIPDSEDLHALFDATDLALSDGATVATWPDNTGSFDLSSDTGQTFETEVRNGNPVVRFDGVDDYLDVSWSGLSQPNHIFAVAQFRTWNSGTEVLFDSNGSDQHLYRAQDTGWDLFAGAGISGGTVDNNWHIHSILLDGPDSEIRIDGAQVASGDAGAETMPGLTLAATQGLAGFGAIDVGEMAVYPINKSSNREAIESYLADKWGISLA
jgi:hypothetical protein